MKKFRHLHVPDHWEHYWTRYPEGFTILEALLNWVGQVDDMVDNQNELNNRVDTFRQELDEFIERFDPRLQTEVIRTLKEWQTDGFLDVIIDDALQTQMDALEVRNEQQINQNSLLISAISDRVSALDSAFGGTFTTLAKLNEAHPTGNNKRYVVIETGDWYYWNGTAWTSGGNFQSSGISKYSVYPSKTNFKFDFFPITSYFGKRTIDQDTGAFVPSSSRYTSDYLLFDTSHTVVSIDPAYEVCVRLFGANKELLYTSPFRSSIALKDYETTYPTTVEYLIYVANTSDQTTIADNIGDYLSSVIYVQTPNRPVPYDEFERTKGTTAINPWLRMFPTMNFDKDKLTTDENGYLKLSEDLSTSKFHKWRMYYKTDEDRELYAIKGKFLASPDHLEASNRIFIESSDGRIVWFSYGTLGDGTIEGYSFNKGNDTYSGVNSKVKYDTGVLGYPTTEKIVEMELRIVGKTVFVYIDGVLRRGFDLTGVIGEKINRCGISFRGNVFNKSTVVDYEVQYKPSKYMHFSVDDVFSLMKNITENELNYTSIFEEPNFKFMRDMHNEYGAVFSLYLFYTTNDDPFTMWDVTTKFKQEFTDNSHWLKFGYHSLYEDTRSSTLPDNELIQNVQDMYSAIERFSSHDNIDKIIRFGYFNVSKSQLVQLKELNLMHGTLSADDNRTANVGLSGEPLAIVQNYDRYTDLENGLDYFRSEYRLDGVNTDQTMIDQLNGLYNDKNNNDIYVMFAHSIKQSAFKPAIEWAYKKGIRFDFPMNNV